MCSGIRAVEAERQAGHAGCFEFLHGFGGQHRGRLSGSPPVKTMSGSPKERISSSSRYPCSVVSSRGWRSGCAEARQWTHAPDDTDLHLPDQHGGVENIGANCAKCRSALGIAAMAGAYPPTAR